MNKTARSREPIPLYKYSIFDLPPSETVRQRLNKIFLTPVKITSTFMTEYNEGND